MANRTDVDAERVHGTDPQFLMEKLSRERIYASHYWRSSCFGASVADVVVLASELNHVGGLHGSARTPSPFLCLVLKLLQLGPEREVVQVFFEQGHFKYATVVAAFYLRVVGEARDIYTALEGLLGDYRKIVLRGPDGSFEVGYVDEFVDVLLREEDVCGIKLPRIQSRFVCEEIGLPPRQSKLLLGLEPPS